LPRCPLAVAVGRTTLRHELTLFGDLEARQLQVLDHLLGRARMHALPRPKFWLMAGGCNLRRPSRDGAIDAPILVRSVRRA
jgi:hypothetical protein